MNPLELVSFWHWWILGLALLIIEVFVSGAFFLWMAVAAGILGGVLWLFPGLSWQFQWLGFALFSMSSIVAWRIYRIRNPATSDQPALNRRGEQLIGRTVTLLTPIRNGIGKVQVDDTTWKVKGPVSAAGARVVVIGVDGTVLNVEPCPET